MDGADVDAYLRRIGSPRPAVLDEIELCRLHRAHLRAVPFENLSIHLGEPISLVEHDLIDKIVRRGRGGFCYELNGAFAALLRALGAEVRLLGARVFGEGGRPGPPLDHLALVVRVADHPGEWLADVGFGRHSELALRYYSRAGQQDAGGLFHVLDADGGDVVVLRDGEPQYLIEPHPRELADFVPTCWWQATSPDSHFTRNPLCSRLTPDGRVTLTGRTLVRTGPDGRVEQTLADDELRAAYATYFDLRLDRLPARA